MPESSSFRLRLVGERYDNPNGTSRQDELAQCSIGEAVTLQREPDNPVDPGAVAVYSCRGVQLGYVGADRAAWIRGKIDRGYDIEASIEKLMGDGESEMPLGAVLSVELS